ncbi:MAG: lytic transglycosylase domain-containing protein [Burkholderiales bacterium]|nr:lytic transglycosylase domain-containing protein [Burkholderiales bacterium]MDP2398579.1 lytic transglycosylase domain-containing protein [Burkholderiales bacterium]
MRASGRRAALFLLICVATPGSAAATEAFRVNDHVFKTPAVGPRQFPNQKFSGLIEAAARKAALNPALVHAIIAVESGYNPEARSPKGAIGLMQLMPATASRFGVTDPASSPEANLRAGTRYLRYLMQLFDDQLELVLAAYNAGEHAVMRHGNRIPPFRETQKYVPAVMARYHEWREPAKPPPTPATPTSAPPPRTSIIYMPGTSFMPEPAENAVYRLIVPPYYGIAAAR